MPPSSPRACRGCHWISLPHQLEQGARNVQDFLKAIRQQRATQRDMNERNVRLEEGRVTKLKVALSPRPILGYLSRPLSRL